MKTDDVSDSMPATTAPQTWVTREAAGVYRGYNERGTSVLIGSRDIEGAFSPGELLKIALAGCAGLTADRVISRRVGADTPVIIGVRTQNHPTEDRYVQFTETISLDLSALDDGQRAELAATVERALGRSCTVGSTLLAGADVLVDIVQAETP